MSARLGSSAPSSRGGRKRDDAESDGADDSEDEDDDSQLQKMWGAMIKQKEQRSNKMKKSRLDNLPSLQIEISRDSSNGSDSDSWDGTRDLNSSDKEESRGNKMLLTHLKRHSQVDSFTLQL